MLSGAWRQAQLPAAVLPSLLLQSLAACARDDALGLLRAARNGHLLQLQIWQARRGVTTFVCPPGCVGPHRTSALRRCVGGGIRAWQVARCVVVAGQMEQGDLDGSRLQGG